MLSKSELTSRTGLRSCAGRDRSVWDRQAEGSLLLVLEEDRVDTVVDPVRIVTGPTVCPVDVTTDMRGGSIVIFAEKTLKYRVNCVSLRCENCVEFATVCP